MRYNFIIVFLIVLKTYSQNYKGTITPIDTDGFYKVILPIDVRSASSEDFDILRIKGKEKQEVPYVLLYNTDRNFSKFKELTILSKNKIKDSVTSITIENEKGRKLENITLKIANTKIEKKYNVYGSNNGEDWYGLVSKQRLSHYNNKQKTVLEKTIDFPLNDYKFLRIDFNDKKSLPINILEAGFYQNEIFSQEPIEIKNYTITKKVLKDKKTSLLKFKSDNAHKIDVISFDIETEYFLRDAKITTTKTRKVKKRIESHDVTLKTFRLNSKNKNTFYVNNLQEKEFTIEISNKDNPPLTIKNVQLLQKPICIIAGLKKDKSYEIILDTLLQKPSYDLGNFISDKTTNIKEVFVKKFSKIQNTEKETIKEKTFFETSLFMWICIVLGGIMVVYFALNLLKDMGTSENKE